MRGAGTVGLRLCIMLGGAAILALQGLWWLKHGVWTPLPINRFLDVQPETINSIEWRGVGLIAVWTLEQPISAAVMILGGVVTVVGFQRWKRMMWPPDDG